eukprot:3183864-Pyramimonas_sp.AAC.1
MHTAASITIGGPMRSSRSTPTWTTTARGSAWWRSRGTLRRAASPRRLCRRRRRVAGKGPASARGRQRGR